jgi:hypothetical protein
MTRHFPGVILSLVLYGFALPAGAVTVLTGFETIDGTPPAGGVTGTQFDRVTRNGVASTWGSAKPFPGINAVVGSPGFDAYTVSFAPNATQSVFYEITLSSSSGGTAPIFSVAYLNSFSPANISQFYLGDAGVSPLPGPESYQVVVPAGQILLVVFSEVNANSLANYNFSIDAFSDANRDGFGDGIATPLPGALSLFASGGALLSFLGWRRKRRLMA